MNIEALISLWNHTQRHVGTSGARVCASVLLGLYNGARFPMDVTDLRILDGKLLAAALDVIAADSRHCQHEVHTWLNKASGHMDFGERFEVLAWEYESFKRGRAKKDSLSPAHVKFLPQGRMKIDRLVIEAPDSTIRGKDYTHVVVDELFVQQFGRGTDAPRGLGAQRHAEMLKHNAGMDIGKPVMTMKVEGFGTDKPRITGVVKLNAEQAAAVAAMCENLPAPQFDMDAHARAMNTPHFNDLAG